MTAAPMRRLERTAEFVGGDVRQGSLDAYSVPLTRNLKSGISAGRQS